MKTQWKHPPPPQKNKTKHTHTHTHTGPSRTAGYCNNWPTLFFLNTETKDNIIYDDKIRSGVCQPPAVRLSEDHLPL